MHAVVWKIGEYPRLSDNFDNKEGDNFQVVYGENDLWIGLSLMVCKEQARKNNTFRNGIDHKALIGLKT